MSYPQRKCGKVSALCCCSSWGIEQVTPRAKGNALWKSGVLCQHFPLLAFQKFLWKGSYISRAVVLVYMYLWINQFNSLLIDFCISYSILLPGVDAKLRTAQVVEVVLQNLQMKKPLLQIKNLPCTSLSGYVIEFGFYSVHRSKSHNCFISLSLQTHHRFWNLCSTAVSPPFLICRASRVRPIQQMN